MSISGILLPIPFSGFKALNLSHVVETYLEAHYIQQQIEYFNDELPPDIIEYIQAFNVMDNAYNILASSIAPEIFGHEDVKKGLLLAMVGGKNTITPDGMFIRGNIHVCLTGDPGIGKSQLLGLSQ